jgi:uncharacterized protein YcbK (DUF882 family)
MFKINDLQLTKNFKLSEFACNDGSSEIILDMDLVIKLQKLRDNIGKPIFINSGYRNKEYNKKVGGVTNSQHLLGKAADIRVDGINVDELSRHAKIVGFNGIGIYKDFLHVDIRNKETNWFG